MRGEKIQKALELASINSAHVVTFYNAQDGLQGYKTLEKIREENPEIRATKED